MRTCQDSGITLSLAESCTGGLVSAGLVEIPGCSTVLIEGMVTYSNQSKVSRLNVDEHTLAECGAVSEETVSQMAEGVRLSSNSMYGAAVSGIAGPEGGTPEKPIGTVWFAISSENGTYTWLKHFKGSRSVIQKRAQQFLYAKIVLRISGKLS